jgi:rod shape-determining protein MreB
MGGRRHLHGFGGEIAIDLGTANTVVYVRGQGIVLFEPSVIAIDERDLRTGRLRRAVVSAQEARQALDTPVMQVIDAVRETLERTPPELSADIRERGIVLAGGGVLLRGFPERLRAETGLPVHLAEEPLTCVALGAGRCLDELETIARSASAAKRGGRRRARRWP